jgi:AraC-like DNA-binding protein
MPKGNRVWSNYENKSLDQLCLEKVTSVLEMSKRLAAEFGVRRTPMSISNKLSGEASIRPHTIQAETYRTILRLQLAERLLCRDETLARRPKLIKFTPYAPPGQLKAPVALPLEPEFQLPELFTLELPE